MTLTGYIDADGSYVASGYLPAGTATVELQPDFAGADPLTVGGIAAGANLRSVDIVTHAYLSIAVSGRVAVDAATPAQSDVRLDVHAYRTVPGRAEPDLIWSAFSVPYSFTGAVGDRVHAHPAARG